MTKYRGTLLALVAVCSIGRAAEPAVDFNRDIRPILSNNCYACHGPDEKERKAKLRLDTRDGAVGKPGEGSIVVGKPEESELIKRVIATEADTIMPPPKTGKKLSVKEKELLAAWVRQGAGYATHWSYVKPTRPPVPTPLVGKIRTPIDAFILDRLAKEKLSPSPETDKFTLVRRVALDLTGLPPTVAEVDEFVNDKADNAYEKMVERFLTKPAFGEHWARLWLDLARYADSAGYADDPPRTIWGYRDYVIRSFNQNKPFDRFTTEQIAGDLLPNATPEQIVATAFHRNTMTNNEGGTNDEEFRNVAIVDRVNTTFAVWMGTSMACAQCHTHKYDPITQKEYFRFYAFLNNTADADRRDESPTYPVYTEDQRRQIAAWDDELVALQTKLKTPPADVVAKMDAWEKAFPKPPTWETPKPQVVSWGDRTPIITEQKSVLFDRTAKQDTYTVELPLSAGGDRLTALRLEALPHDSLPGGGPGFAKGNFVLSQLTASILTPAGTGRKGRYIRIEMPGKKRHLMLAEVQAFAGKENLALKGIATQSSTDYDGPAKLAVDGNTDGRYHEAKSTTHTKIEDDPWWELDLNSNRALERIVIWNRVDNGPSRLLANYKISLLDDQRKVVWTETTATHPDPSREYNLDGSRPVAFTSAIADFSQPQFDAASVLSPTPTKKSGWGIAGATGKAHTLTLAPAEPITFPAGSKVVVTLSQNSEFPNQVLGHFRLSYSTTPAALEVAKTPLDVLAILAVEPAKRSAEQKARLTEHYLSVTSDAKADRERIAALKKLLNDARPATTVPVLREVASAQRRVTRIQHRGSFLDLGEVVTEGVPAALHALPSDASINRLAVARWLVDENNPLTARVMTNRLWEQLFGTGLVRTSEEFGSQGEPPSHPELLDWLAIEFMKPTVKLESEPAANWDMKHLLRVLVLSSTYRQTSKVTAEHLERDPDNRLLGRGPRHRLSAEMIRDQALAVSGLLSPKMFGPSVRPPRPSAGLNAAFGGGLDWQTSAGEDRHRRGLYTEWRRTSPYPSMATFDAPSRESCTIRRSRSNTPLQALVTLNDPVYVEAAQSLGRKMAAAGKTDEEKLTAGFLACLSRPPSEKEQARLVKLYQDAKSTYAKDAKKALAFATQPIGPLPPGGDAIELAAWTVVGNVLLNLDEMLMRR